MAVDATGRTISAGDVMALAGTVRAIDGDSVLLSLDGKHVLRCDAAGLLYVADLAAGGSNSVAWGDVTGTLASQTDLASELAGKQPLDATLTALAATGSWGAGRIVYLTGTDTYADIRSTAFGRALVETADAAAARATLSVQQASSELTALAALTSTSFGRSLLELASAGAAAASLKFPRIIHSEHGNPVRTLTSTSYSLFYSLPLPANTLASGSRVHVELYGTHRNNSGANGDMKCQVVLGGTSHNFNQASVASSSTDRAFRLELDLVHMATGVQSVYVQGSAGEATADGGRWVTTQRDGLAWKHMAEDETTSLTLTLNLALASATDSNYVLTHGSTTLYPGA